MANISEAQHEAMRRAKSVATQYRMVGWCSFGFEGGADYGPGSDIRTATVRALEKKGLVQSYERGLLELFCLTKEGERVLAERRAMTRGR